MQILCHLFTGYLLGCLLMAFSSIKCIRNKATVSVNNYLKYKKHINYQFNLNTLRKKNEFKIIYGNILIFYNFDFIYSILNSFLK